MCAVVLIQRGLRSIGVSAFRASTRRSRLPSGCTAVTIEQSTARIASAELSTGSPWGLAEGPWLGFDRRRERGVDLLLKKERLQRAGCPHYWVVDPDEPSIVAWSLDEGVYREVARASGAEAFEVAEPFAVRLTPASLVD